MSIAAKIDSPRKDPIHLALIPRLPVGWIRPAVILSDAFLIIAAGIAAYIAYSWASSGDWDWDDLQKPFALSAAVLLYFVIINDYRRNYTMEALSNVKRQVSAVTVSWVLIFALLASFGFLLKIGANFSRGGTLLFFFFGSSAIIVMRLLVAKGLVHARTISAFAEQKILVIADPQQLASTTHIGDLKRYGIVATTILPLSSDGPKNDLVERVIDATLRDHKINSIVIIAGWEQIGRVEQVVQDLRVLPLSIRLLPDERVAGLLGKPGIRLGETWTKELQRPPLSLEERALKRSVDLILAVCASLVLLPVMLMVALLIKLDSKGPVLFTQTRNGFGNHTFRILKFRTLHTVEDGAEIKQVSRNDNRVTTIGRLLRRTSIDELPQLWNIIRGDMSIVGPRPHAAAHNSQYGKQIANYAFRHHVKPGLTGWAQVNGFRGETRTVELMIQRVNHDLWYIDNWSVWIDIKIILRTFVQVLVQPSAY